MRKFLLLPFFFITLSGAAQLELGFFGGGSFYMGDLNPSVPFLQTRPAFGVLSRYNFSSRWVAKVNLYQGKIVGDDEVSDFQPDRALSFESGITEFGGVMEFHFLPYFIGSMRNYYTPYLFGGIAAVFHRPKRDEKDLRDFGTEGQNNTTFLEPGTTRPEYSYTVLAIPFGMGIKYSFSHRISASIEWGMRKTFFDYLDDVSTTYYLPSNLDPGHPDYPNQLYSDPNRIHEPMMQRGNSKTTDWYSFAGITLTYYLDLRNRNKCSEFQDHY
ncbi:MAG: DUF6089 family protein [Bacteroidales bacterium]